MKQWKMESVIGPLFLVACDKSLHGVFWKKQKAQMVSSLAESKILRDTVSQLEEYFRGERKIFDLPLEAAGTEFQRAVWGELKKIPYGKTLSYRDVARNLKNDKAMRAVGSANGKNPLSIIVPCHRVIAATGGLGGYAGGLPVKEKLLALEGAVWRK